MNAQTDKTTALVLIGLGSNINPDINIISAINSLDELTCLKQKATIWQTPAIGSQGSDYLNTAVLVETNLSLMQFKTEIISRIENNLGRIRFADKYSDRTIDLDILTFGDQVIDAELWSQAHVTIPAAEILPALVNHKTGESLSQAANRILPGIRFIERDDLA